MSWRNTLCHAALAAVATVSWTSSSTAQVFLTEFNSNASVGNFEFCEFTNMGTSPVDMTDWSQDDSGGDPGETGHFLTGFGLLQPGESAIFTEATPSAFKIFWWGSVEAAPVGLKIVGPYTNDNLSSNTDAVYLFNPAGDVMDLLEYTTPNSANGVTRNPMSNAVLGLNQNVTGWVNSQLGDVYGSFAAAGNANLIGNPGKYTLYVPEPASIGIALLGMLAMVAIRRGR